MQANLMDNIKRQSSLISNLFRIELSRRKLTLPYHDCSSWQESGDILRDSLSKHTVYTYESGENQVRIVVFDGPGPPSSYLTTVFDVVSLPYLGTRLIQHSIAHSLQTKGLKILHSKFDIRALPPIPTFSQAGINVFCGISLKAHRPFEFDPMYFVILVKWEVVAMFSESLATETIRNMSIGLPVLYKPTSNAQVELSKFRDRYMGYVREVLSPTQAVIHCKDGHIRNINTEDLYIEASPSAIREFERRIGLRDDTRSAWRKIQELNFVLTKEGRRNRGVLQDRLNAIRRFLIDGGKDQLVIPLACFEQGILTLNLSPVRIDMA
jgi:hypothetical protein